MERRLIARWGESVFPFVERAMNPQPRAGVRHSPFVKSGLEDGHGYELKSPYGYKGDTLWIAEIWRIEKRGDLYFLDYEAIPGSPDLIPTLHPDASKYATDKCRWRSPVQMPRWASRTTILIKGTWCKFRGGVYVWMYETELVVGALPTPAIVTRMP